LSFGELLANLMGWLGETIQWIISFVPRYLIVRHNERAVLYIGGGEPVERGPGLHWYWPWRTATIKHPSSTFVLRIPAISMETKDGIAVTVGMVVVARINKVLKYEVENFDPDQNMVESAQGALRNIISELTWERLRGDSTEGSVLDKMLSLRMSRELTRFGVEVLTCRPNDQVRIGWTGRLFGVHGMDEKIDQL